MMLPRTVPYDDGKGEMQFLRGYLSSVPTIGAYGRSR